MSSGILAKASRFVGENAPTILTIAGVGGMIGTAICAAQAAIKSKEIVEQIDNWSEYSTVDKVKTVAPVWAPTVAVGAAAASAIVGSNCLSVQRGLALGSAYTMAEKSLDAYKNKVEEKFGKKKLNDIREEIAQDQVNENEHDPEDAVVCDDPNEVISLCMDSVSGRYFYSSIERLKRIEADLNAFMMKDGGWVSLNDLYERIGLEDVSIGDDLGWDINGNGMLDIHYDAALARDEQPCIVINYEVKPKYRYYYGG